MKLLPSWIRLARFNWSSFTVICFIYQYPDTYRSNLTPGLDRFFKADARVVPGSRPRLGLMFTRVFVRRKLFRSTSAPSWSGIGQVARPAFTHSPGARRNCGPSTREQCLPAPQQPPGSSCCPSLLAGGFRLTTTVQTWSAGPTTDRFLTDTGGTTPLPPGLIFPSQLQQLKYCK